jgi:Fe-S oxidoreductase
MAGPYRGSPHPGLDATAGRHEAGEAILGRFIAPETVWACTTCRACVDECPMMIEHVDAVVDLRRFATLETGSVPGQAGEVLDSYQRYDTPGGRDPTGRFDWASGLGIPVLSEGQESDVLLWVGEAGFDGRGQRTLRATVALLREAGVDFAVLGSEERDTGDLARRLGDEATFQRLARRNVLTLSRRRFRRIVTNDPHVRHALAVEYPAFGGRYEVLHHTQLLRELLREGRLRIRRRVGSALTYHDPCYLGRYAGEYDAPREILAAIGADIREMGRARHRSRCCGGGGGAPVTDIPGKRRIPDMRMDDARSVGAATVAVACPTCAVMLEGTTGEGPEVADIAELVAAAVFAAEAPS